MTKLCLLSHIAFFGEVFHKSLSYHIIVIIDKVCMCRTGEHGHPTRTPTRVYRVPNMRSDRHTKEPGSMAWRPEHIFTCRDDHIVIPCLFLVHTGWSVSAVAPSSAQ